MGRQPRLISPTMILYILPLSFLAVSGQGIFNVVRFPNSACGSANNFNGTCYTASECNSLGGSSSGTCASGFGVCCVFSLACGSTTSANTSYATITSYSTTSDRDPCTYKYCKCSNDVCKLRIDFETMVIADPFTATPAATDPIMTESWGVGDCLTDTLSVGVPGYTPPPVICGYNTGQHMYVPASDSCVTITLDIDTATSTTRNWQIKVTQYECGNLRAPEEDCLQYHTATTGVIATFNWDTSQTATTSVPNQQHLSDQYYNICIRRARGLCSICYSPQILGVAAGDATSYGVSTGITDTVSTAAVGTQCTGFTTAEGAGIADNAATAGKGDFLFIPNMQNGPGTAGTISGFNMICGGIWNTVNDGTGAGATGGIAHTTICSFDTPFRAGVHFDSDDIFGRGAMGDVYDHTENRAPGDGISGLGYTGFQLAYWQNTC